MCNHVRVTANLSVADHIGSKGVSFNMLQNPWTLALFLALIFHGGMDREGTQGTLLILHHT